jgi:Tfp pilus assembly protein PilF
MNLLLTILGRFGRHPWKLTLLAALLLGAVGVFAYLSRGKELLRLAETDLAAHEYSKARQALNAYLTLWPRDARGHLLAARAARRLHDDDDALEHLRQARENGGSSEAIAIETRLINLQRLDDAPDDSLRRRAEQPDELGLVVLEALIQFDIDTYQLRLAQQELSLYLSRRPNDLQALLGRAFVWERFLNFADAVVDYRQAVAAHPENDPARFKLADALLIAGTPEEALTEYERLAQRWPDKREIRFGMAKCARRLGKLEEARVALETLAADWPDNGEVQWERGLVLLDQRRPREAEGPLRQAATLRPYDRRICYSLSQVLRGLDRPEEAQQWSARADQLDADVRRLHQVSQEVMQRPNDAKLRCEGGLLFLRNGEPQQARRWLEMALRLDPTCAEAQRLLAEMTRGRPSS